MNRDFIVTKEHRRFTEFAGAIRKDVTIGILRFTPDRGGISYKE